MTAAPERGARAPSSPPGRPDQRPRAWVVAHPGGAGGPHSAGARVHPTPAAPRALSPARRRPPLGARPPATWGRGPAGAGRCSPRGPSPRPSGAPPPPRAARGRGRGRGCCCAEAPPLPAPGPSVPRGPRRHCAGWAAGPRRDGPGAAAAVARPERRREQAGGGRGGGGAAGDAPRRGRRGGAGRAALVVGSAGHRSLLLALPHGVPPAGLRDRGARAGRAGGAGAGAGLRGSGDRESWAVSPGRPREPCAESAAGERAAGFVGPGGRAPPAGAATPPPAAWAQRAAGRCPRLRTKVRGPARPAGRSAWVRRPGRRGGRGAGAPAATLLRPGAGVGTGRTLVLKVGTPLGRARLRLNELAGRRSAAAQRNGRRNERFGSVESQDLIHNSSENPVSFSW